MSYIAGRPTRWIDAVAPLPFVPFTLASYEFNGRTRYAYAGLRIPRGLESRAYPLTSDSAIVSVDGFIFDSPDALPAMLSYGIGDTPYVEVFYVQLSERPQRMRRAYIPRLTLAEAGADWRRFAQETTVGERNEVGEYIGAIAAFAAMAVIWNIFQSSASGEQMRREYQACVARAIPLVIC